MGLIVSMGRGGTGKTSFVALVTKYFIEIGETPIFLIDADPDQSLAEVVGIDLEKEGIETISELIIETFLPFTPDPEMLEDKSQVDFLYEPDKESILNVLIPKHLNTQIWRILLESYAAEQGARMTAMESATDNAEELVHNLTIYYNRTRQAAITKEIAEIVGGAEALKES